MKIQVIFSQDDSRMYSSEKISGTMELFTAAIKKQLNLDDGFRLQYYDNDFSDFMLLSDVGSPGTSV